MCHLTGNVRIHIGEFFQNFSYLATYVYAKGKTHGYTDTHIHIQTAVMTLYRQNLQNRFAYNSALQICLKLCIAIFFLFTVVHKIVNKSGLTITKHGLERRELYQWKICKSYMYVWHFYSNSSRCGNMTTYTLSHTHTPTNMHAHTHVHTHARTRASTHIQLHNASDRE